MRAAHMETILIVGGGFTGSTLAAALSRRGRTIRVLEARTSDDGMTPGRRPARFAGELIHATGVEVLERYDLLAPLLEAGGVPIDGFAVFASPEALPTRLPYPDGGRGLGIDHHRMVAALRAAAARRPGVVLERGARVVDVLREGGRAVGVRTESGEEHRADLVLVAEGRHSRMRAALGIACDATLVSYTAALKVTNPRLPVPSAGHIFLGRPGPILAYAISRDEARLCFDLPEPRHPSELRAALRALAENVPRPLRDDVLAALDGGEPPQLVANHAMVARSAVAAGAALVGDAGGCAHPLTAGGMTLCLNDVQALQALVDGTPASASTLGTSAFLRFDHAHREALRARAALTHALYEVFAAEEEGMRALRAAVFEYWTDPRNRAASVALLSGADTRLDHLAREYARVAWTAVRRRGAPRRAIVNAALGQLRDVAKIIRSTV
jgi:2-polyprenyl-6-methoxyphenol hydroxylase-like FAD-dependent oxidoreductase